ncbi:MAG: hypothetical protein JJ974_01195 [Phycisphaerales bacterium]|nr:hypothetical protein [Phycisphaerales bacterium]
MSTRPFLSIGFILATSSTCLAGLSDFVVMSDEGHLLRVNGETLEASLVADLDITGDPSRKIELEYISDSQIYVKHDGGLSQYNASTSSLDSIFTQSELGDHPDITFGRYIGMLQTSDRRILGNAPRIVPGKGIVRVGVQVDTHTNLWDTSSQLVDVASSLDMQMFGANQFVNINGDHLISVHNFNSSEFLSDFWIDNQDPFNPFYAVSIFESDGQLLVIDPNGEIYSIDPANSTYARYGQITGIDGLYLHAASTVPTPSSIAPLAITLLASRGRRSS